MSTQLKPIRSIALGIAYTGMVTISGLELVVSGLPRNSKGLVTPGINCCNWSAMRKARKRFLTLKLRKKDTSGGLDT